MVFINAGEGVAGHGIDKAVMIATSETLVHSWIDIIAGHYLYSERSEQGSQGPPW